MNVNQRIVRNCDKCGNEDSCSCINGLCMGCESDLLQQEGVIDKQSSKLKIIKNKLRNFVEDNKSEISANVYIKIWNIIEDIDKELEGKANGR